jgi:hypothetical protein
VKECKLDSSCFLKGQVWGSCEQDNKPSVHKEEEFIDQPILASERGSIELVAFP